ncbi:MAG TPA: dihydrofolate reductase family protein [Microlunatus sp.]|nr:dihydrofolate reductase family protein [Microlunatus sp.]
MITRPYVTLNCAISLDGCLDDTAAERLLLSGAEDFDRVDDLRARSDGILVGANTIRRDDPRLVIRSERRRSTRRAAGLAPDPMKITITGGGAALDPESQFFTAGDAPRLVYAATPAAPALTTALRERAEVIDAGTGVDLERVLTDLAGRGCGRLLVEGGGTVLTQFLARDLFDELHVAVAPLLVGDPAAPRFVPALDRPLYDRLELTEVRRVGTIALLRYRPRPV